MNFRWYCLALSIVPLLACGSDDTSTPSGAAGEGGSSAAGGSGGAKLSAAKGLACGVPLRPLYCGASCGVRSSLERSMSTAFSAIAVILSLAGLGDGSVRSINPTISEWTYWAAVTPSGNETLYTDW